MEIATMSKDVASTKEKTPFILMFYVENGERKSYKCNWPEEFVKEFADKVESNIEVPFFFVMEQRTSIHSIEEALKFCKG